METDLTLMCCADGCRLWAAVVATVHTHDAFYDTRQHFRIWWCWLCLEFGLPEQLEREDVESVSVAVL